MFYSLLHVLAFLLAARNAYVLGDNNGLASPEVSSAASQEGYSITQVRNPNYKYGLVDYTQHYAAARRKFDPSIALPSTLNKRQLTTTVIGVPTGDAIWAFPITLGTPPQISHVILDTGSTGFWVFSTETKTTAKNHAFYSPSASSTSRKFTGQTFVSNYASGSATGDVYQDKLGLGTIIVSNFFVGSAVNVTSWFETYNIDGTLGLNMDSLDSESPTRESSFLQVLSKSNTTLFSVDFNHNLPSTITFGAIPPIWHLTYVPANPQTFDYLWAINLTSVNIGMTTASLPSSPFSVVLDTGTNYIALPDTLAASYYSHVPSSSNSSGLWQYPCNSILPSLGIGVSGASWTIPGQYLTLTSLVGGKTCIGVIQGGAGNRPILGVPLFEAVGVVFDYVGRRVGFAQKPTPPR